VNWSLILSGSLAVALFLATMAGALEAVGRRATTSPVVRSSREQGDAQTSEPEASPVAAIRQVPQSSPAEPPCHTRSRTRNRNEGWELSPD
jgi:hypothetical protein